MNNIHEKDWAEESWCGHTGMDSSSDYCVEDEQTGAALTDQAKDVPDHDKTSSQEESCQVQQKLSPP
ncbi:hypothetical protein [Desulfogranum mediterraneum]|uniref:hypothetical protein n=1 Tax=Desulfogranum mediterraneum TaxID=160661 RepID=UPI00041D7386|nr:hypothetical protein [Desulfogranum mediterraneum]